MEQTMKAVVLHGPDDYAVENVAIPEPGYGEVLVEIRSVAICGSDPGIFRGDVRKDNWPPYYPFIAGHEFAGKVVKLGEGVGALKIGDRVAGEAHCGCGICDMCKQGFYNLCRNYGRAGHHHYGHFTQGCYAQYQVYDQKALTVMPDAVSYDEGAMADTAGTAYNGIHLVGIVPGGWTLVIGPGPMGNMLAQMAKAMGSKTIVVGYNDADRLKVAKEVGADHVIETTACEDVVAEVKRIFSIVFMLVFSLSYDFPVPSLTGRPVERDRSHGSGGLQNGTYKVRISAGASERLFTLRTFASSIHLVFDIFHKK